MIYYKWWEGGNWMKHDDFWLVTQEGDRYAIENRALPIGLSRSVAVEFHLGAATRNNSANLEIPPSPEETDVIFGKHGQFPGIRFNFWFHTPHEWNFFQRHHSFGALDNKKGNLLWRWTLQTAEIHVDVAPPGSSICITEAQLQLDDPWARTQQKGGEVFEKKLSQHDPTWVSWQISWFVQMQLKGLHVCGQYIISQAKAPPSFSGVKFVWSWDSQVFPTICWISWIKPKSSYSDI